ncbi:2-oxo-4-hydroxy-4-carboxy-5-ureidoimidazoline decarboxylase [Candidatus Pelagibacter sp.]|nr:2-oxo-4-hydroxy-4-carboxy-5-ureidoimidazoline decarboxylase [Candidatus Pelagibacter sp.]MDC1139241.1 2-oxo-4-hydroxy-4-carboxy-5-ureidoimidazoline decarboxylase [Candidatus Pelagibacter sp.]
MKTINSIEEVNQLTEHEFIGTFGNVFEKTNWIANKAFNLKPYKNFDEFITKIIKIYENSSKKDCLKIFNAHPELAVEKKLTEDSHKEQRSANLNRCNNEEFNEFKNLNIEYRNKFGFPFIIAVKGKNKNEILNNFRRRIKNEINLEFNEAKEQVKKIATFRLNEIIN